MATRTPTRTEPTNNSMLHTWTGMLNGDDGSVEAMMSTGDRCVQVLGTFGVGGTVVVEGSLDGANWFQLRDPSSTLLSFTAAGGKAVLEAVTHCRPRITAGDGTTSLSILISTRRG